MEPNEPPSQVPGDSSLKQGPGPRDPNLSALITASYPTLQRMAIARAASSGVSPSSLAHETIARVLKLPTPPQDETALHGIAGQLMKWILIDRIRQTVARKKAEANGADADGPESIMLRTVSLSDDVAALAELDARKADVVSLWAVAGLTMAQIAESLQVSEKTVQRDLDFARSWLAARRNRRERGDL